MKDKEDAVRDAASALSDPLHYVATVARYCVLSLRASYESRLEYTMTHMLLLSTSRVPILRIGSAPCGRTVVHGPWSVQFTV